MTQRERVLRALRNAGPRGVHTFELREQFIGNPSQRIAELEAAGHQITHTRERLHGTAHGTRYRLVSSSSVMHSTQPAASQPPVSGPAGSGAAGTLFDPATTHTPAGAYDDLEDAA